MNDRHACPECGVEVGRDHRAECAFLNTMADHTVWLGPPLEPGLVPRVVVDGDSVSMFAQCLHCRKGFKAGDVVFENPDQTLSLHASCVVLLAQMVPRSQASVSEVEAEFEHRRRQIVAGR